MLLSIGIACLISVPVIRGAAKSQGVYKPVINEYQPIVLQIEYVQNIPAEEVNRASLVNAELQRQNNIDNPYVVGCDQGIVTDPYAVLNFYQLRLPDDVKQYCDDAQKEFNVSAELLEAIAFAESSFDSQAVNGDCLGLMQISTKWHKDRMNRLGVTDIYDTRGNIRVAADYLRELFNKHDGELYEVLMIYNGDTSEGVSDYALKIEEIAKALEIIHGK